MKLLKVTGIAMVLTLAVLLVAGAKTKKIEPNVNDKNQSADSVKTSYKAIFITQSKACACTKKRCDTASSILDSIDFVSKGVKVEHEDLSTESDKVQGYMKDFGISFVPALLIFDNTGKELKRWVGLIDSKEVKDYFNTIPSQSKKTEKK